MQALVKCVQLSVARYGLPTAGVPSGLNTDSSTSGSTRF